MAKSKKKTSVNVPPQTEGDKSRGRISLLSLVLVAVPLLLVIAIGLLGNKIAAGGSVSSEEAASWKQVVVAEKITHVSVPEIYSTGNFVKWTSLETDHYLMLNNYTGTKSFCPGLTIEEYHIDSVYPGQLLTLLPLSAIELRESILVPRPSNDVDVKECKGVVTAGDHFEYHGKTVAILRGLESKATTQHSLDS